jgi:hypothetical protein
MSLNAGRTVALPFVIPATELAAGTSTEIVSPVNGFVTGLQVIVQTAIVTGGDVTVNIGTTAVTGLTATVADAAAKGAVVSDSATQGTTTRAVNIGDRLQIVPASAFNGGGALAGNLLIWDGTDLSNQQPW